MSISKANEILIELAEKYQNIKYKDICVPVPYFINTAEQIYKQEMSTIGIERETISKILQRIKDGKTPLGSGVGKGSPEEITRSLERLMVYLGEIGYYPKTEVYVRGWMAEMHIGLECSGYVCNILAAIENSLGIEILKQLAWREPETKKPSHAGAFIFDSERLTEITDYEDLKPLDMFILRDHSHMGILAEYKGDLCFNDCAMEMNGISFNRLFRDGDSYVIEGRDYRTEALNNGEFVVRRVNF